MDNTHLGRSGASVSRICLGTMNFGAHTEPDDAHQIMDHALEQGINFFDTANTYGRPRAEGVTESIVGDWLTAEPGRRDKIVLATKLYGGKGDWPNDRFLSAINIRQSCEASLRRLKTDHIDLYQMHHVDRSTSWDEIWEAMAVLRAQGKVLYVGSSNFAGWHIAQAQETARRRGPLGLVSEQSLYNLAERRPQIEAYEAFCTELGHEPAQVALAWLLHQPAVTAPIVGPRTLGQLKSAIMAEHISLDEKALARLDQIFPGPGGAAPEAYAW